MTRKDFELVAAALKAAGKSIENGYWWETINIMADYLSSTNERFDRQRFIDDCK